MDIKLTDSTLRYFIDTAANPEVLSANVSLCGPTFDRIHKYADDYLYEIEVITNRVDTASAFGVARESVAILNQFQIPSKLINDPYKREVNLYQQLPSSINIDIDHNTTIRFTAITLENITITDSPSKTQNILQLCGQRPINNLIDITNELTLLYGMPSHVFDLDKLAMQNLKIRYSSSGEQITTLDQQNNLLTHQDIIIEDGSGRIVDLCGVMGGQIAEVDPHTKNCLFIVPVYTPKPIRETSLRLQKRTLAAQIYEKQPDPELTLAVLSHGIDLIKERTGGVPSSQVFDYYPNPVKQKTIDLNFHWLNSFIGIDLIKEEVITILASLGFTGKPNNDSIACNVPSWRYHDINIKEDLAEEVARIHGYFRLPSHIPCVNLSPEPSNPQLKLETTIKDFLSITGFNEVYNNSLVSNKLILDTNLEPQEHLKVKNSLSTDFEYLRTSLVPSLLLNLLHNQGKQTTPIHLFEIANIYIPNKNDLPKEIPHLVLLTNQDYRTTKGIVESLFAHLHVGKQDYKITDHSPSYYQNSSTATISIDNITIGYIGAIKQNTLKNLRLDCNPIICQIDLDQLTPLCKKPKNFKPLSDYPPILEDITIESTLPIGNIITIIENSSELVQKIVYINTYQNKHSFQITFGSNLRNLEQEEINTIRESIRSQITSTN